MPSLIFNYGEWTYWDTSGSNPGPMKVTFDGPNKLILINEGETSVDVQADVYSNWKQWSLQRDNTKFLQAISTLGGATTTNRLEEIWKILGLDLTNPQIISDSSITVGGITLSITQDGVAETTTVARQ